MKKVIALALGLFSTFAFAQDFDYGSSYEICSLAGEVKCISSTSEIADVYINQFAAANQLECEKLGVNSYMIVPFKGRYKAKAVCKNGDEVYKVKVKAICSCLDDKPAVFKKLKVIKK